MARAASQKGMPQRTLERNRYDKLYNDILTICEKEQLLWKADEINTLGVSFVCCVCDALRSLTTITMCLQAEAVRFQKCLQGYNLPQMSKLKKTCGSQYI